ncbi:glycoside hydrolase family 27 protein [Periconia macrospinosa]|uniref:Alpha-galactosidase n=1 Tax=Periconia macrospinosa TaxID=97972 RepID=A0A2V1E8H4_9PLEO|nr:glycoside hydrolase family 27 protein [Periconia macrospinosa]
MGWNNWNAFQCEVSEELLLQTAQYMVDFGLRDAGYNYIVLDDCWSSGRNDSGYLIANSTKFPQGMPPLISDIHALGFKFGIYSSAGVLTCARYAGSLGYEQKDADLWASWGVDYLKYDNCFNQGQSGTPKLSFDRYKAMSDALLNTGKKIVYSLCNWGNDDPYDWAQTISNSGRMSGDIIDTFNRPDARCPCTETIGCTWPGFHCSVMNILNKMPPLSPRTMEGYFNDMDMLEVGNGGQSDSEYVLHFSMWAMNSSPLLIGTDVRKLSPANLAIYSNPAIIAINQDKSASAAHRNWRYRVEPDEFGEGEISMWTRRLSNGDMVLALLNAGKTSLQMNTTLGEIFLDFPNLRNQTWDIHDLWANRMSDDEARRIIEERNVAILPNSTTRFNATAMSYEDGIKNNHPALMGSSIGLIEPGNTFEALVERHGVSIFRLKPFEQTPLIRRELNTVYGHSAIV